jgi:RHS repeat-associated protein
MSDEAARQRSNESMACAWPGTTRIECPSCWVDVFFSGTLGVPIERDDAGAYWVKPDGQLYAGGMDGTARRSLICPHGFNVGSAACSRAKKPLICEAGAAPKRGNPTDVHEGAKLELETDFSSAGDLLGFSRFYNSAAVSQRPDVEAVDPLGDYWRHSFQRRLLLSTDAQQVSVIRQDGNLVIFRESGGLWTMQGSVSRFVLEAIGGVNSVGWRLSEIDGSVTEEYDAIGRLVRMIDVASSRAVDLFYDANGRLDRVTAQSGRSIVFYYDGDGLLERVSLPDGSELTFLFDSFRDLKEVQRASVGGGVVSRRYDYVGATTSRRLAAIYDEIGHKYAEFTYDSSSRVISSLHRLADNAPVYNFAFEYPWSTNRKITSPLGDIESVSLSWVGGILRVTRLESGCATCGTRASTSITYDANGFRDRVTDRRGIVTDYDYDSLGRELRRVEAQGTPNQRTTTRIWDYVQNRAASSTTLDASGQAVATRSWVYNARGQIATTATAANAIERATGYSYCEAEDAGAAGSTCPIVGLLKSTNGPRTDISDLTTYTYYPTDDASCASSPTTCPHRKGDLQTVTNAAGQVAQYLRYDGAGRLLESVDPNGVRTTLTYHPRGWLTSRTVGSLTTSITYDAVGQVIKTTQPDGSYTTFSYDAAHRLTGIADNLGNRIDYTLDAAGNRTAEATKDAAGVLKRSLTRVYDQLGRLSQSIDALGAITQQTYDANGNADLGTDALGRSTDQDVDPLNRLKKSLRDVGGVAANTAYAYDAQDNLTEVTDPNGLKTHYTYNGLNDLLQLSSPDTGTTSYTYDAAGNRLSQTDARGVATNYSYDALNRLTDIAYPDAALNVHFDYDLAVSACDPGEQSAIGRLSGFTDASGNTALCYDPLGRLTRKQQTTAGIALTTIYAYTANGRLSQMTTPGGMIVSYGYDGAGRISGIDTQLPGEPSASAVIDAVRYLPFGPIDQITYGNGRIQTRSYDANYAIDQVSSTGANGLSLDFAVDAVGNLTQVTSGAAGNLLAYDGVDRLTEVKQLNNDLIEAFAYDATGNRTAHTDSAGITPYSYTAGSHRLSAVGTTTRSLDAAGNTTAIGGTTFTYDARNRLSAATVAGQSTQYQYNARGERVSKAGTASTIFVYDEAGHLLGEYAGDGSVQAEYVWLGDLPVAVRNADDTMAYMEPDHLGTPRSVIDPVRDVAIWQWPLLGNAFGDAAPVTDPDGDGVAFAMNLRFPGQYYDAETGLHYNYFRDYDPVTGRYVESDPIGLDGGVSTYGYVDANPAIYRDPFGLEILGVHSSARVNDPSPASGHGWLAIYSDDGGLLETWGAWQRNHRFVPEDECGCRASDVYENIEKNHPDLYTPQQSVYIRLSPIQLARLRSFIRKDWEFGVYRSNCAAWVDSALEGVYPGIGVAVTDLMGLGATTPRALSEQINIWRQSLPDNSLQNPAVIH